MRTMTRRWWRAAAVGLLAAASGYLVNGPDAAAQPPAAAPAWMRSSSPLSPAAAAATRVPPPPGAVIPASAVLPVAQPPIPPLPTLPATPKAPPVAPPEFKAPAVTVPSAPSLPALPPVAPPAPPAKSAPAAQPAAPAKSVSPLQSPNTGNTVKTDAAWKAPEAAPQPRAVADRPKPPQPPVAPSERDVFPLPALPAAPVAGPVAVPTPPALPTPPVAVTPPTVPMPPDPAPAVPAAPVATTPGANPMTFKSTAAAAVIGGALVMPQTKADAPAGGAVEAQTDKDKGKTTDEKLGDIQRDLRRLTELLDGKRDETGTRLPSDPGLVQQVRELKDKFDALQRQVNELKSTSLRPPTGTTPAPAIPGVPTPMPGGTTPAPAAPAQGTVRVVNEYPIEITMVVNGRSHRVAPNATVDIPVAAGDFSYQLLSGSTALAPTRSTLRAAEVVTLRIK